MSTNTRTRTRTFTPQAQVEAALAAGKMVWIGDLLTPAPVQAPTPKRTPAEIKTHVATVRAAMIAETTPAPTQDMFQASGAHLRKLAYTPTGRTRTTPEAQAALGEIARRAARKAARKAAR